MTLQELINSPAQCSALARADVEIMVEGALAELVEPEMFEDMEAQRDEEIAAKEKAEEEYREKDLECDRLLEVTTAARGLAALLEIDGEATLGSASRQQLDALRAALDLVDGKPVPAKAKKTRKRKA